MFQLKIINETRSLRSSDFDEISSNYENFESDDKRVYGSLGKMALKVSIDFFEEKGYDLSSKNFLKNKKNVIKIKNKKENKEISVKVLVSGIDIPGLTREGNSESSLYPVISQRSYLIDKDEVYSDQYLFVDRNAKYKEGKFKIDFDIFAILPGKFIGKMLFQPLRSRFIGKKFCILKKESYNKGRKEPFSIMEIFKNKI